MKNGLFLAWTTGALANLSAAAAGLSTDSANSTVAPSAYPPKEWPSSFWPQKNWQWATLESVKAAPRNHKVLWENDQIRFVEVTIWPGETENLNADPYPSVLAFDAPLPPDASVSSTVHGQQRDTKIEAFFAASGGAPPDKEYPTCATEAPQAPHQIRNRGKFPVHFYQIEYKRIEGYALQQHWKQWHPWLLNPQQSVKDLVPGPQLGPPYSKDWPYPIVYDSIRASPNNHFLRYEDAHLRLLEVAGGTLRPENLHGHPYPSVFAMDVEISPRDMAAAIAADVKESKRTGKPPAGDRQLDPNDPRNNLSGSAAFAAEKVALRCVTQDPQAPHGFEDPTPYPVLVAHFYRIEFIRIDGDAIKSEWRAWYPNAVARE